MAVDCSGGAAVTPAREMVRFFEWQVSGQCASSALGAVGGVLRTEQDGVIEKRLRCDRYPEHNSG